MAAKATLLDLTNELLLHVLQFVEPGPDMRNMYTVCKRFLRCTETPHLWRLIWQRWLSSDLNALEDTIKHVTNLIEAKKTKEREGNQSADASTEGRPAEDPEESAPSLCFKPPERLACEFATECYKLCHLETIAMIRKDPETSEIPYLEEKPEDPEDQLAIVLRRATILCSGAGLDQVLRQFVRQGILTRDHLVDTSGGTSAMHTAARRGRVPVIRYLLEQKADPSVRDSEKATPLYYAAKNGHVEVIRLLVQHGADVDNGKKPGHAGGCGGCECGLNLMAMFFGPNPRSKPRGSTPLWIAAARDQPEAIKALIELGADINKKDSEGSSPFFNACLWDRFDAVKALLDPMNPQLPDVNEPAGDVINRATPLYAACEGGRKEVVAYLLENAARIGLKIDATNKNDATPLYISCQTGAIDLVEQLIAAGANIEARRKSGATPLLIAANYGHEQVVEKLIAAGADINAMAYDGSTPLSCAASSGHHHVVKRLIKAGADVNASKGEKAAVYLAQQAEHLAIVVDLLAAGAIMPDVQEEGVEEHGDQDAEEDAYASEDEQPDEDEDNAEENGGEHDDNAGEDDDAMDDSEH